MSDPVTEDYILILGTPILKRTAYFWICFTLLLIFGFIGLIYALIEKNTEPHSPELLSSMVSLNENDKRTEILPSYITKKVVSPEALEADLLAELIGNHIRVTGIDGASTLLVKGELTTSIQESKAPYNFSIFSRAPNLHMLKIEREESSYLAHFGYNGEEGWIILPPFSEFDSSRVLFYAKVCLFEISLAHIAWTYKTAIANGSTNRVLKRLNPTLWKGRACEVISSQGIFPFTIVHYIDSENYREVYRRAQIPDGDQVKVLEMHFSESPYSNTLGIPEGHKLFIDGELRENLQYTTIRSNDMITSSLFNCPSDASARGLFKAE